MKPYFLPPLSVCFCGQSVCVVCMPYVRVRIMSVFALSNIILFCSHIDASELNETVQMLWFFIRCVPSWLRQIIKRQRRTFELAATLRQKCYNNNDKHSCQAIGSTANLNSAKQCNALRWRGWRTQHQPADTHRAEKNTNETPNVCKI